jgi:hypothetical protein
MSRKQSPYEGSQTGDGCGEALTGEVEGSDAKWRMANEGEGS